MLLKYKINILYISQKIVNYSNNILFKIIISLLQQYIINHNYIKHSILKIIIHNIQY